MDKISRSDRTPASTTRVVEMEVGKDSPRAKADLVFVIDTTGSMEDKIDGLIRSCQRFVDVLATKRIDWQVAIVGFGDLTVRGDRIVATGFSSEVATVRSRLQRIPRFSGGGNDGESSLEALQSALALDGFRDDAMKVAVLITDEPALQHRIRPGQMTDQLRRYGVLTFVISPPIKYFRAMAKDTGGMWFQVSRQTELTSILAIFDDLARRVATTVSTVQQLTGGDVRSYLGLPPAQRGG
jgi:hypothetical protein